VIQYSGLIVELRGEEIFRVLMVKLRNVQAGDPVRNVRETQRARLAAENADEGTSR